MASVHMTAYVEGEEPRMMIDLILDCPDVFLHDSDSARTFLYESICDIADDIRSTMLLELE